MSITVQAPVPQPGGASIMVEANPGVPYHVPAAPPPAPGGCSTIAQAFPGGLSVMVQAGGASTVVGPGPGGLSVAVQAAPDRPYPVHDEPAHSRARHASSVPPSAFRGGAVQVARVVAVPQRSSVVDAPKIAMVRTWQAQLPAPQPRIACAAALPRLASSQAHSPGGAGGVPQATLSDLLDQVLKPGDVLFSKSPANYMAIGAAGGLMGHVAVVTGYPQRVLRGSLQYQALSAAWPSGDVQELWCVQTMESTSLERGLFQTETLLYVEPNTRRLKMVGDVTKKVDSQVIGLGDEEVPVDVWQSPPEIRSHINPVLVAQVVAEMELTARNWSAKTAMRALLLSKTLEINSDTLSDLKDAWLSGPICTSVVITFWQRYLCKLAELSGGARSAVDLMSRYMPLRADRALPSDLVKAMRKSGWVQQCVVHMGARLASSASAQRFVTPSCGAVSGPAHQMGTVVPVHLVQVVHP